MAGKLATVYRVAQAVASVLVLLPWALSLISRWSFGGENGVALATRGRFTANAAVSMFAQHTTGEGFHVSIFAK